VQIPPLTLQQYVVNFSAMLEKLEVNTNGEIVLSPSFRDTLSFRSGKSSEPISLTDAGTVVDGSNSGELGRPVDSCCPERLVVEFEPDPPVLILELPLPLSLSGQRLGAI
jgi:hypothetical protein